MSASHTSSISVATTQADCRTGENVSVCFCVERCTCTPPVSTQKPLNAIPVGTDFLTCSHYTSM